MDVTVTFLSRYTGWFHNPMSQNSPHNFWYKANRFLMFLRLGGPLPDRKSGGMHIMHGSHKRCGHSLSSMSDVSLRMGTSIYVVLLKWLKQFYACYEAYGVHVKVYLQGESSASLNCYVTQHFIFEPRWMVAFHEAWLHRQRALGRMTELLSMYKSWMFVHFFYLLTILFWLLLYFIYLFLLLWGHTWSEQLSLNHRTES